MQNIKRARHARGLTQDEVADALDVSRITIGKWERGDWNPEVAKLPRIANFFGMTLGQVLDHEEWSPPGEDAVPPVAVNE